MLYFYYFAPSVAGLLVHRSLEEVAEAAELTKEDMLRMFAETDRRFKETDRRLDRRFQETDRRFRDTDRRLGQRFRETDEELTRLERLLTGQWGKLIEALVAPSVLRPFQERGIRVTETQQRVKSFCNGAQMEVDILLVNDQEEVVTEVKTAASGEGMIQMLNSPDFRPKDFGEGLQE